MFQEFQQLTSSELHDINKNLNKYVNEDNISIKAKGSPDIVVKNINNFLLLSNNKIKILDPNKLLRRLKIEVNVVDEYCDIMNEYFNDPETCEAIYWDACEYVNSNIQLQFDIPILNYYRIKKTIIKLLKKTYVLKNLPLDISYQDFYLLLKQYFYDKYYYNLDKFGYVKCRGIIKEIIGNKYSKVKKNNRYYLKIDAENLKSMFIVNLWINNNDKFDSVIPCIKKQRRKRGCSEKNQQENNLQIEILNNNIKIMEILQSQK